MDVLNNLLLFIPFAAGLGLSGLRLRAVVAIGALFSLTIESLQLLVIPGRDASLSDLLTNTLGTWLGGTLARHRTDLLKPTITQATRLAIGAGIVWIAVQSLSAVLLRPWVPQATLYGGWVARFRVGTVSTAESHLRLSWVSSSRVMAPRWGRSSPTGCCKGRFV